MSSVQFYSEKLGKLVEIEYDFTDTFRFGRRYISRKVIAYQFNNGFYQNFNYFGMNPYYPDRFTNLVDGIEGGGLVIITKGYKSENSIILSHCLKDLTRAEIGWIIGRLYSQSSNFVSQGFRCLDFNNPDAILIDPVSHEATIIDYSFVSSISKDFKQAPLLSKGLVSNTTSTLDNHIKLIRDLAITLFSSVDPNFSKTELFNFLKSSIDINYILPEIDRWYNALETYLGSREFVENGLKYETYYR